MVVASGVSPEESAAPVHFKSAKDRDLIRLALHKSAFFSCLDEQQVEKFVDAASPLTFEAGEVVILEGCIDQEEEEENENEAASEMQNDAAQIHPHEEELDEFDENIIESKSTLNDLTNSRSSGALLDDGTGPSIGAEPPIPPPMSDTPAAVYIVREGTAEVWYQNTVNPASLGPGAVFGEGGFLFGRQHSASVLAASERPLQVFVLKRSAFLQHVLPASEQLRKSFDQYAENFDSNGTRYMTFDQFVQSSADETLNSTSEDPSMWSARLAHTYRILKGRSSHDKRITFKDYCFFRMLLSRTDPEVDIAFLLIDSRQRGRISLEDLRSFVPSDVRLDTDFFTRHFSGRSIRPQEFSQFLVGLQQELASQAFERALEKSGKSEGYLLPVEFVNLLKLTCASRLPTSVQERLEALYCLDPIEAAQVAANFTMQAASLRESEREERIQEATEKSMLQELAQRKNRLGERAFGYADFVAFSEVLENLSGICRLIERAQTANQSKPLSIDDVKEADRNLCDGRWTRRQMEIIFLLFDLDRDGLINFQDAIAVCGPRIVRQMAPVPDHNGRLSFAPMEAGVTEPLLTDENDKSSESLRGLGVWVQHLGMTTIPMLIGLVGLYPVDLIKNRLMNQQRLLSSTSTPLYTGALSCGRWVFKTDGAVGFYRGLLPSALGVLPRQGIKLYTNGLLRQLLSSEGGERAEPMRLSLPLEGLAGACTAACQLLVTNPVEIVKIRLQLQGKALHGGLSAHGHTIQTATSIVRQLGFPGVYYGASACLLRDVPFGALSFASFAAGREYFASRNESGRVSSSDLILSGSLAAVPAALLTTPADVIRARIHSHSHLRPGRSPYRGIRDCALRLYQEEGISSFFRGASMRVMLLAPQFGISICLYDQLSRVLGSRLPPSAANAYVYPVDFDEAFTSR